jgi:hypothetical protein
LPDRDDEQKILGIRGADNCGEDTDDEREADQPEDERDRFTKRRIEVSCVHVQAPTVRLPVWLTPRVGFLSIP